MSAGDCDDSTAKKATTGSACVETDSRITRQLLGDRNVKRECVRARGNQLQSPAFGVEPGVSLGDADPGAEPSELEGASEFTRCRLARHEGVGAKTPGGFVLLVDRRYEESVDRTIDLRNQHQAVGPVGAQGAVGYADFVDLSRFEGL